MKVGIITYHAAHNCGSVLQAYATQKTVADMGHDAEIINFRMESQKRYYSLYPRGYGMRVLGQDLAMLPLHAKRAARWRKFEEFIAGMKLSGPEMADRAALKAVADRYDVYLAGSDQIWSDSIIELVRSSEDFSGVYFFDFVDNDRPRVAYASSVGEIRPDRLAVKEPLLKKFTAISTREQYGVDLLRRITGRDVALTLDPTFLLDGAEWGRMAGENRLIRQPYIFLYTLHGLKHGMRWGKALSAFAKARGLKFVAVSPFFPIVGQGVHNVVDAGPLDFLNLVKNAELVFTDSFHGTAFSINLNRPFYSCIGRHSGDNRKLGIMRQFGLEGRALEDIEDIGHIGDWALDYQSYLGGIEAARTRSREWLRQALEAAATPEGSI